MATEAPTPRDLELRVRDLLGPRYFALSTDALAAFGPDAVPCLVEFFEGRARNEFGVPYLKFGEAVTCAVITAGRLGPGAQPLLPYLADALDGTPWIAREAAQAIGNIGSLDDALVARLVALLDRGTAPWPAPGLGSAHEAATEAALALVKQGQDSHPTVQALTARSHQAAKLLQWAISWHSGRPTRLGD